MSVFFYLGEKFWEGHPTDIGSQGFHAIWIFWIVNSRRQDAHGSSWSKRRFFFYLVVISYANSTCKVKQGEDVDDSCPKISFTVWEMSASVIETFADERLLPTNLGISFFPSRCFEVAVKGNSIVLEIYPRPRP